MRWMPLLLAAMFLTAAPLVAGEETDDPFCEEGGTGGTPGVSYGLGSCTYLQYRLFPPVYCPGDPDEITLCQGTIEP